MINVSTIFHYTDRKGFNGIRSAQTWKFEARKPPPEHHPTGAYFSRLTPNQTQLAKRLRVSKQKIEFCFEFEDRMDLIPIRGERGNDGVALFSPSIYLVETKRQRYNGSTVSWKDGS